MKIVMLRVICLLLVLAATAVLVGCGILGGDEGEVRPLESKVLFAFKDYGEKLRPTGDPDFYLNLSTEKTYTCHNCKILAKVKIVSDTISVQLLGVHMPPDCDDSPQHAKSQMVLDIPDGDYTVLFLYDRTVDSHRLSITPSSIRITKRQASMTEPMFSVLQR